MGLNREKILTNVCIGSYFFMCGVEYAVILPTLNGYLISMHGSEAFLGIIMASFSFTGLIAAPIYGRITDNTGSTKLCVIIGNLFEIVGNFLYFVSSDKYMLWGSRLIAGTGSGAGSSIFGMISRSTTAKERTQVFSVLMCLRQIGLLIGPGFNVFLHSLDFKLGPFKVDQFTSPGLLMAVIWTIHSIMMLFLFKDPTRNANTTGQSSNGAVRQQYEEIGDNEVRSAGALLKRASSVLSQHGAKTFVKEFIREEVIVCLSATFMIMFAQTGLEAVITPLTLLFFDWDGLTNSYLYCGAGAVVIASFILLGLLSKKCSDRSLILAGCVGMVATYVMFLCYSVALYVEQYIHTPTWLLPAFLVNVVLLTLSLPFIWVPQASLFSKITSMETQAFNQGIRLVSMGLGQITGPIWASSMATVDRLYIMVAVDLFLMCVVMAMVCTSYKYLVPIPESGDQTSHSNVHVPEDACSERTALLQDHVGSVNA